MRLVNFICMLSVLFQSTINTSEIFNKPIASELYDQQDCKQSSKNTVKIKITLTTCNDNYSNGGLSSKHSVGGCKKKFIIKIKIKSFQSIGKETKVLSVQEVTDSHTNKKLQLLNPLVVKIKQHDVYELYTLKRKRKSINGLATEEVINNACQNFTGCQTNTESPTCGYTYNEGVIIPFSQGFCCSCDTNINNARQPCEIDSESKDDIELEPERSLKKIRSINKVGDDNDVNEENDSEDQKDEETESDAQENELYDQIDQKTQYDDEETKSDHLEIESDDQIDKEIESDDQIVKETESDGQIDKETESDGQIDKGNESEDQIDKGNESHDQIVKVTELDDKIDQKNDNDGEVHESTKLPMVKIMLRGNLIDISDKIPLRNKLNITLNNERWKRQHNGENQQVRGLQKCDDSKCILEGVDKQKYFESAHCLRFSKLWYTPFKLGKPVIDDELSIKVYTKHDSARFKKGYCWGDLTSNPVKIGSLHSQFCDDNNSITASYKAIDPPTFSLNNEKLYLLVPQPLPKTLHLQYPQATGKPCEFLVVDGNKITFDGTECDKAGVGFEAFAKQPARCNHKRQTCLKNQPIHFWENDIKARKAGEKGRYFLENYVREIPKHPIIVNKTTGKTLLKVGYSKGYNKIIELHIKADEIVILKSGLFAIISQVYTNSLHSTTISAFVVNLDMTASIFQINLKCPNEVSYVVRESNDVIPPQHLKKFTLIISNNLKSSQLKCDLQVVNTAKKVVASRSIVLSKGHRCVCAWHCRCACDNHDHLRCEPLSLADYNRAGYLGQLPIETKGSSRFYITFLKYVICFFECLMVGGIMKAIGSLLIPSIGTFGLWFLFPNKAKGLKHYNEDKFRQVKVIYDEEGFPIHPVKRNRNVRFMPRYKEFAVNCAFFILALISNIIYHHRKHKNYFSLSPSNSSSGDTTTYRYSPIEEGSILGSKSKNGSEDHLAEKYVSNLIDAYHVYRNLSRPLGGVNCVPGTPYSVCGIFSKNVQGKYEFTPTPPFKQYWMMDRSPIKPGIELNPEPFSVTFNTAEEVLLANDITQYPRSIVINMISSL